mmetsp:Transcript_4200/g.9117  ORF Transcript_4200/g.9117 Transcript_4200/m.9117 type:complete len:107 (-) Transcript_4200:673-993(-)
MHDVVSLERLGLPSVAILTDCFAAQAAYQASALGAVQPGRMIVLVNHPVSDANLPEMQLKAERSVAPIVRALTTDAFADAASARSTPAEERSALGHALPDECAAGA